MLVPGIIYFEVSYTSKYMKERKKNNNRETDEKGKKQTNESVRSPSPQSLAP